MKRRNYYSKIKTKYLQKRQETCTFDFNHIKYAQIIFGIFVTLLYLLCFWVYRDYVETNTLFSLLFQLILIVFAGASILCLEMTNIRISLHKKEVVYTHRTVLSFFTPEICVFSLEALHCLRVIKKLDVRGSSQTLDYFIVLDKPWKHLKYTLRGKGSLERFYQIQRKLKRGSEVGDSLLAQSFENDQIVLYNSSDFFKLKENALSFMVFGLGDHGFDLFEKQDFIVEKNHIEL